MTVTATGAAKRVVLEILGWSVLVLGLLALVLPGPGLLLTFSGLAILSTQYSWARRWVEPVKIRALKGAAEGVETLVRITLSTVAALILVAVGVLWASQPPAPHWWPLPEMWWLFGGTGVGVTLLVSSAVALALLGYSVRRFYRKPEAVAEVDRMVVDHRARVAARKANRKARHDAREAGHHRERASDEQI